MPISLNTIAPEKTIKLKPEPIVWVGPLAHPPLLLLADFRAVTAIDSEGLAWTTAPLSMEGLTELRVEETRLRGKGWDAIRDSEFPVAPRSAHREKRSRQRMISVENG